MFHSDRSAEATEVVTAFADELERLTAEREAAGGDEDGAGAASDEEQDADEEAAAEEDAGGSRAFKRRAKQSRNGAPAPARRRLSRPLVPLRKLQRLAEVLSQARGVGAVALLDGALLGRLLAALQGHVELGMDKVVTEDEEVGGAGCACLRAMTPANSTYSRHSRLLSYRRHVHRI